MTLTIQIPKNDPNKPLYHVAFIVSCKRNLFLDTTFGSFATAGSNLTNEIASHLFAYH